MAKLVSRRRMLTGHCHGFQWLRAQRRKRSPTDATKPRPDTSYLFDDEGFVECRDYDRSGQLVRWRLYRRDYSRREAGFAWAWELIEGRVYDNDGKRLATFGAEDVIGRKNAHATTYVYDGTKQLSRTYDEGSQVTTVSYEGGHGLQVGRRG